MSRSEIVSAESAMHGGDHGMPKQERCTTTAFGENILIRGGIVQERRAEGGGRRAEDGGRRTEDGRRKKTKGKRQGQEARARARGKRQEARGKIQPQARGRRQEAKAAHEAHEGDTKDTKKIPQKFGMIRRQGFRAPPRGRARRQMKFTEGSRSICGGSYNPPGTTKQLSNLSWRAAWLRLGPRKVVSPVDTTKGKRQKTKGKGQKTKGKGQKRHTKLTKETRRTPRRSHRNLG